ncbi:MAG: adenosylmethionine--8-amino-7-oxononanoate transaminase [Planctomycetes bacterium]|nr:adenosylmethionine--8-amino-7-oxononanoate transaminase [Planctomycetota bacterium]
MTDKVDVSHRSDRLRRTDQRCLWHPFTPMRLWLADEPVVIERGEGFWLIDTDGRRYIDGVSSLWCNVHGHRVEQLDEAIRGQLDKIAHSTLLGLACDVSIELAEALLPVASIGGELTRVFYSDSGSEAVEIALKIAYQYWQNKGQPKRRRFIALREGYHGDTVGSVSLGGIDLFHKIYHPLLFETIFVDSPCPQFHPAGENAGEAVLDQLDVVMRTHRGEICAVTVEPLIQGAGGMLTHARGFLQGLRELTRRHDVLLIADEVATGFGRTGRMFACHHEGVACDLMCMAKGLTGGYLPLAATLTTEEIFEAFLGEPTEGKTFYHGHTYTGNALACAVALASLKRFQTERVIERMAPKIDLITRRLAEMRPLPNVARTRQCGFMVGIDLARADGKPFDLAARTGAAVCQAARRCGIIIRPLGDTVVLMPAPAMDAETLDRLLAGVTETIDAFF